MNLLNTSKASLLIDSTNMVAIGTVNLVRVAIETQNQFLTDYLIDNFEKIMQINEYNTELLNEFRKLGIDKERLRNIQEKTVNEISGNEFIKFVQSAHKHEGLKLKFDYNSFTKHLLKQDKGIIQDEISIQMISRLIQELCEHEGIDISQIEFGGTGHFNKNLKIGEYVLKISPNDNRRTVKIRKDKRIIKPILRQQTNVERRKNIPNLFIEIQNVVETNWYDGLSEGEIEDTLYSIFAELMDRGLRWTDIKEENVGRLLKPNKENFYIDGEELVSSDYATGYYGEEPDEVLGPGELVVIDTDYIYESKWKQNIKIPLNSFYQCFLTRYEEEQQQKQEQKINDSIKKIISNEGYTREATRSTLNKLWNLVKTKFRGR